VNRAQLDEAVRAGILSAEQAGRLEAFLSQGAAQTPRFSFVHVLYCLGGWGGLSLMRSGSELGKFLYLMLNVGMILTGALLGRRVFAVFGGLGVAGYLGYLSHRVFRDSLLFPFALSAIGLAIIAIGVLWQRREAQWSARLRAFLPKALRELLEARAA